MFIKTILIAIVIAFAGCVQKDVAVKYAMFQSVSIEDALLLQEGADKKFCPRCGMDLVKYYKTNHSASHKGIVYQYCSIHCLEEHLGEGIELKNPMVVDVASLKFIDVTKANYVIGSRVRGTMSKISKYAFSKIEDAKIFQAKNGGEIMDFYKALEVARGDFKNYR